MTRTDHPHIKLLDPRLERSIQRNPLLNIDTFIIPSPYIRDIRISKDYGHSYVWVEEGEVLGYMLVYSDEQQQNYHIYKIVTSPFGRGRGIGNTFINYLAGSIPELATIYLYLWEKQVDTIDFFHQKGFRVVEPVVYRNRRYMHLAASAITILERTLFVPESKSPGYLRKEDIGKTRHDARKTIRLLSHLVDTLSQANAGRIIEDINRETTALVNTLNEFRDRVSITHEIDMHQLILERIVPFIRNSPVACSIDLKLKAEEPLVMGYYTTHSRAIVNIVANALDAIGETDRRGVISIQLTESNDDLLLEIEDNGCGIDEQLLKLNDAGIPEFVGQSSKAHGAGEGLGTVQVFETFGPEHLKVTSRKGVGTCWSILLKRPEQGAERWFAQLERRYHEFQDLIELQKLDEKTDRVDVIALIWQLRKMEIFLYDVIGLFSKYHNIREIYRSILRFLEDRISDKELSSIIKGYRGDHLRFNRWLYYIAVEIHHHKHRLRKFVPLREYRGPLFRSYGQAVDRVMIFTLDPADGRFFATDRKLAEHLDFVPYLEKPRDQLLRGEMIGDLNDHDQPIILGVWSIDSHQDLMNKLKLLQSGAQRLLEKSIHAEKLLGFYPVTYLQYSQEINPDFTVSLGEFVTYDEQELLRCVREADDDFSYLLPQMD
jgi:N-acetylglutamate synthase-like GNAT family acetyltransferase